MFIRGHSRTAEATAAIRAWHLIYDHPVIFTDPFALGLTNPVWRTVGRHPLLYWTIVRGFLRRLRPVHGWILVRDRATETCLQSFVARGNRQYVLLGAGFDSIALRRPDWLRAVRIIEVDHPATQAVKLSRIAQMGMKTASADFEAVALDFERDDLANGLARSTFEPGERTFFAWQGVIYYLTEAAIQETLEGIARVAAPGSELIFDFLLPEWQTVANGSDVISRARSFASRLGESYISFHTPGMLEFLVGKAGFEIIEILSDEKLEERFCSNRRDGLSVMRGFGIAHVRRV